MRFPILLIALMAAMVLPANVRAQSNSDEPRAAMQALQGQVRANGSYLGVRLVDIDADRARTLKLPEERGVEVTSVEEDSPAAKAGIKTGDVLLKYNDENILGAQQFVRLVRETPQGRKVNVQIWRDGKTQTTVVTTGAPKLHFEMPPTFVGFNPPDMRFLPVDTPTVLMAWKNSLLGVECESLDSQLAQYFGVKHGALVRSVGKGSPAEKAGIKAGDVLTAIGDRSVATAHDMISYERLAHEPGKPISVSLVRDHKQMTVSLVPLGDQQ
jgi:serine protease Do